MLGFSELLTIAFLSVLGILEIKEHISNPFRDDITDYSFKMSHARLQNECMAFFKCAMDPPYTNDEDPDPAVLPPQVSFVSYFVLSSVSSH